MVRSHDFYGSEVMHKYKLFMDMGEIKQAYKNPDGVWNSREVNDLELCAIINESLFGDEMFEANDIRSIADFVKWNCFYRHFEDVIMVS